MAKKLKTKKAISKRIKITSKNKMLRRSIQGKYKSRDSGVLTQQHRNTQPIHASDKKKFDHFLKF